MSKIRGGRKHPGLLRAVLRGILWKEELESPGHSEATGAGPEEKGAKERTKLRHPVPGRQRELLGRVRTELAFPSGAQVWRTLQQESHFLSRFLQDTGPEGR